MTHAMNPFQAWAAEQLDAHGVTSDGDERTQMIRTSVLTLAKAFGELKFGAYPEEVRTGLQDRVLQLFNHLATGRALPPTEEQYQWRPARYFPPSIGQIARIRLNAYTGEQGVQLNGKVGRVVHFRRGIGLVFDSDPDNPQGGVFPSGDVEVAL